MTRTVDFLVVGSGIAGLSFALKAAKHGKVLIVTKSNEDESNTKYAQGGVAVVVDKKEDSFEKHIQDTLIAGDGLCDKEAVEIVVKEGPERINEIINYGTNFDKTNDGFYDLAKEGGHSEFRVLHYKDITGYEIESTLLEQIHKEPNIEILTHYFAVDLITQHHLGTFVDKSTTDITCFGIYAFNNETHQVEKILSKATVMASGGAGHIYSITTNPTIATGDGVAMVYRAKGKVRNMEFIQFHPTALYNPGDYPSFLISEAVRGFGGVLKRINGEEFMGEYDERKSLAPRDIVARAIDAEIKRSGEDFVYLDIRHRSKKDILAHFPNIYAKCLDIGIDMTKDMIPVAPACHYMCGGIMVDHVGQSSILRLYACGECSSTGLHGANRLASNSLLEALVFAHRIYEQAVENFKTSKIPENIPDWNEKGVQLSNEDILVTHNLREMQKMMNDYVGIVRSDFRLERAMRRLGLLFEETEDFYKKTKLSVKLCELRNLIQVSYIVIKSAMMRKESRGLHSTTDYPYHQDVIEDTVFKNKNQMRPLKLAPTISTPELAVFSLNLNVAKRIKERESANIVEGYTITEEVESAIHKFYSEVNIDNDRLWSLIKYVVSKFPTNIALIYHHIDDEPTYGEYVDKYELINELEKYRIELTQDGFLKFGVIHHGEDFLEEIFVEKSKYIKYWGMDKEAFVKILGQFELYPVDGLNFIDEYPLQTEVLSLHCETCLKTEELLGIFDDLYKVIE